MSTLLQLNRRNNELISEYGEPYYETVKETGHISYNCQTNKPKSTSYISK